MIVITGGAGFIGSNLVYSLNQKGLKDILIVEELDTYTKKFNNLKSLDYLDCIDKDSFLNQIKNKNNKYSNNIECIFHLGACSKTTEPDRDYILSTNLHYSKDILKYCSNNKIPLIYASSASVYGSGTKFYEDQKNESYLNHYAESKLMFDQYYRDNQSKITSQVVGLRYFNVFGPREHHKEGMSSVVYHFYNQIIASKSINLFKGSHGYKDGEQRRDFIFVDDTINVKLWFLKNSNVSGIYNVGTGLSRSFNDIANAVIKYFNYGKINYIDFPDNLESQYQAYTQADMTNLKKAGYLDNFTTLESGVEKYLDWLSNNS
jgi:ADP-L-glycero-D-manno-heptose 6-epimerase